MDTKAAYVPGVCNIGLAEIGRRRRSAWSGLVATGVLWAALAWLGAPAPWRLLLFFPALVAAAGFFQARMRFCAYFGFSSLFNFGDVGKADTVHQAAFRAEDRRTAWRIVIYSVCAALAVAALGYAL